jgi:hypothetical protein
MLITDKFVMLNFPKTGSTFAREALKAVHQPPRHIRGLIRLGLMRPRVEDLKMLPWFFTKEQTAVGSVSQHGTYLQIPHKHRSKPVVSVVRDPFTRIVSLYEYRDWQKRVLPPLDVMKVRFPHFPELSFEEFLDMQQFALPYVQPSNMQVKIGPLTTQFIRFYARDPMRTITELRDDTDLRKDWDLHFPEIHFLHMENLNQELHALLAKYGFPQKKIAPILGRNKVNVSRRTRSSYLSPRLMDGILHQERFFFQLFPEYLPDQPA